MKSSPKHIEVIGQEVAIEWEDGEQNFIKASFLRKHSPSAENVGERDILGNLYGGTSQNQNFSDVTVEGWEVVGNYAIRFIFSDKHQTGLYSYDYLKDLAAKASTE